MDGKGGKEVDVNGASGYSKQIKISSQLTRLVGHYSTGVIEESRGDEEEDGDVLI